MSNTNERTKRKHWTREETIGFLSCYAFRKDEFKHARKKNLAYQRVLEDMIMQDIAENSTNASALESRMRTLLIAYKNSKEKPEENGNPHIPPPYYMKQMEEIFGDDPIVNTSGQGKVGKSESITVDCDPLSSSAAAAARNATAYLPPKRRRTSKEEYYERKLELTRRHFERTEIQKEEFLKDMKTTFKDHLRKMVDVEKKKLELLQEFVNKKKTNEPELYTGNGFKLA